MKLPRILPKVATSTSLLGSFTCRKFATWDRRLYFPSEGRRARKIRRFRPSLNPRTRVPEASTLTSRPPKPLKQYVISPHYLEISLSLVATAPVSIVSTTQRVTKLVLHPTLEKQPDVSSCANLRRIAQLICFQSQYMFRT